VRLTKGISVFVSAACAGLAVAASLTGAQPTWLDGLLFDSALAVRAELIKNPEPASHVAVIAVDPESLNSPELAKLPRTFFGPVWGKLIKDLTGAEAKVVAFDFLFSYSASQFQKGYDRPFLAALYRNRNKVVLARSRATVPARNYLAALRNDPASLGSIDAYAATDEVYRTVSTQYTLEDGDPIMTLSGAALRRAGAKSIPREIVLAPKSHPEAVIPTYGLATVLACARSDPESLKAAFGERVIFVGTTLPEEDRKTSVSRFMRPPAATASEASGCGLRPLAASVPDAQDIPGVFLHAMAAEAVLGGNLTEPATPAWAAAAAGTAALAGAAVGFLLAPVWAVLAVVAIAAGLWIGEVGLLGIGIWLPTGLGILFVAGAAMLAYLVRFVLEEGKRRRIQKAFGYYLAPALVDRMVETAEDLQLGGEKRHVTIMFADLSGFTALSGLVGPEELVSRTNAYLTIIAEEVEDSGGYVDKFIGDAVMAIWGAPVDLEDHAVQAVKAAIRISERIAEQHALATAAGEHGFAVKIGVNTGEAVVGNVGSEKRFNYTAVGEAVNIAARLEGLPGVYDCRIIVGETTATLVRDLYGLRELDMVAVKGKSEPLRIFEPLDELGSGGDYTKALTLYRDQAFAEAAEIWDRIGDGPSNIMAGRARAFQQMPPPVPWDGVFVMTTK